MQVHARLLDWIESGRLIPGERLREDRLAMDLGVSRTPLREALLVLEQDGLLASQPHRGFMVTPRDEERALELYPLIGALEALAVRSGQPSPGELDEMDRLAEQIRSTDPASEYPHGLSQRWHEIVSGAHTNRALNAELRRLRRLARLHRGVEGPPRAEREGAVQARSEILRELRLNRASAAARRLERHWVHRLEKVIPQQELLGEEGLELFPERAAARQQFADLDVPTFVRRPLGGLVGPETDPVE
jgi:DNA-binding GntR family transcriptional regulator